MKHPHSQIINQWLKDTTQEIEIRTSYHHGKQYWADVNIDSVLKDSCSNYRFRVKPKPDEYEHLRQAIRDGKKIELLDHDDSTWVLWENVSQNVVFVLPIDYYRIHDPYRELREAQEQGKRIVWQNSLGDWEDLPHDASHKFDKTVIPTSRFKIVEHDVIEHADIMMSGERKPVRIKLTKSGIDGTIKAEVI